MPVNDDLFRLVNSMKPSEKRYFKRNAATHKAKNYLELFDLINRMKVYDETGLKKKLAGTPIGRHLPSEKNYLMKSILASLRDYHANRYDRVEVSQLLYEAQLLHDRNLYDLSGKILTKAKELAQRHEMHLALLEINALERVLVKRYEQGMTDEIDRLISDKEKVMDKLSNYFQYRDLNDTLFCSTRGQFRLRDKSQQEEIKKWFSQGFMTGLEKAQSFEARRLFLTAWGQYFVLIGKDSESHDMHKQIARLWEDHPERISEDPKGYKVALANYLNLCHLIKAYSEFPDALLKIKSYPPETIEEEGEDFQNLAQLEFLYCINTGQFIRAQSLIETEIKPGLEKFPNKVSPARQLSICHSIAMLYLVTGDFEKSRKWALRMTDRGKSQHRHDLQRFLRILEVLLAFEQGTKEQMKAEKLYQHLNSLQKSAERWLKLNGGIMQYERGFLRLFVQLAGKSSDQQKKLYQDLNVQLEQIPKEENQRFGQRISELRLWLKSKIERRRMEEIILGEIRSAGF